MKEGALVILFLKFVESIELFTWEEGKASFFAASIFISLRHQKLFFRFSFSLRRVPLTRVGEDSPKLYYSLNIENVSEELRQSRSGLNSYVADRNFLEALPTKVSECKVTSANMNIKVRTIFFPVVTHSWKFSE
jgi:hypothetical protein